MRRESEASGVSGIKEARLRAARYDAAVGEPITIPKPDIYLETMRPGEGLRSKRSGAPPEAWRATDSPWGARCAVLVFGGIAVGVRPDGSISVSVLPAGVGRLKAVR